MRAYSALIPSLLYPGIIIWICDLYSDDGVGWTPVVRCSATQIRATRAAWGVRFGQVLSRLQSEQPDRDFLVASGGKHFSLHSCKATTLSWALQLDVKESWRIAQGHHKPSHKSAQKYGRDDAALPETAVKRHLARLATRDTVTAWGFWPPGRRDLGLQPHSDATDSESSDESSVEESAPRQSDDEDDEVVSGSVEYDAAEGGHLLFDEDLPWVLNSLSGMFHKAVEESPLAICAGRTDAGAGPAVRATHHRRRMPWFTRIPTCRVINGAATAVVSHNLPDDGPSCRCYAS